MTSLPPRSDPTPRVPSHRGDLNDPPTQPPSSATSPPEPAVSAAHVLTADVYEQRISRTNDQSSNSHRTAIWILAALLALAVAAASYLGYLASKWSSFGEATHSANYELGETLLNTQVDLDSAKQSLENTRNQLTTAQQRISELAKEKALVGDDREQQRIIAQDTTAVATESLAISRDLARCLDLQIEYSEYLNDYASAQNIIASQMAQTEHDRDTASLSSATSKASGAIEAMKGIEENLNDVCSAAVERHNKLVEDLRE